MTDQISEPTTDAGDEPVASEPASLRSPKTVSHARVAVLAVASVALAAGLVMVAWSSDRASYTTEVQVDPRIKAAEQDAVNVAYAATTYRDQNGALPEPAKGEVYPSALLTVDLADGNTITAYEITDGPTEGERANIPALTVCVAHADGPWALYDTATELITGSGVAGATCRANR